MRLWHCVSGTASLALGLWHCVFGTGSLALGLWHWVSGTGSLALGLWQCVSGSVSLGRASLAVGIWRYVFGGISGRTEPANNCTVNVCKRRKIRNRHMFIDLVDRGVHGAELDYLDAVGRDKAAVGGAPAG